MAREEIAAIDRECEERHISQQNYLENHKSFSGLSGIVTNGMRADVRNGDVYIFMNAGRNMMKMLRREEGGLVLYAVRLDMGRKNYLFCGNHDAAVRAAIVYSLFASRKARGVEIRPWLEDTLGRLPAEKDITALLPENWHPATAQ